MIQNRKLKRNLLMITKGDFLAREEFISYKKALKISFKEERY